MAKLLVFCEAPADARTVKGLVDRVLREQGPDWLRDQLDGSEDAARALREWVPDDEGRDYFDLHKLSDYARRLRLRVPQGHFDGRPGAAGAIMARTAFRVARELALDGTELGAALLVWDMDGKGEDRRRGLEQARTEARSLVPFALVLGCAEPMREAWVLAGFDPESEDERDRLDALRQELGFHPSQAAHRIGPKDIKDVLEALTAGAYEREERCWLAAPLSTLRQRGQASGLTSFLDEVASELVPVVSGG
jgi:hypothetical protein